MYQSPQIRTEAGEHHPLNPDFRRIFGGFPIEDKAEYLLERYANSEDFNLLDSSVWKNFVTDSLWQQILNMISPNRGREDWQTPGLTHSIIAAGQTARHLYLAIVSRNDSDEMVLPAALHENEPRVSSSSDFCGHFAVVERTNRREKSLRIVTAISPDLAQQEITRFVNGDFNGAIGQRVGFNLSLQNIGKRIEKILFSTELLFNQTLLDSMLEKIFGVMLEGGSLVTFNIRCDRRLFWEICDIRFFPSDAKAHCSKICANQDNSSKELGVLSRFWKADIEDCADILHENLLRKVASDCLREISGPAANIPTFKKARFHEAFIMPHQGMSLDNEPLISRMRLFLKFVDSDKTFIPSKNGTPVQSDCYVVADLSWRLGRPSPHVAPFGLLFSAEAMKAELLKVILKDHDSILRPMILEVIKKQDPRFKKAEINEISYRISKGYSDSEIVFAVEHQFGLSLVHLSRIGKTNLISFTDSWMLLGALDSFETKKR